ncbi:MAG: hypothetical protein ACRDY1_10350 [Acidimicrobiales bacterium]
MRTRTRVECGRPLSPVERALMLIALDLDPRFTYTDHELQTAWRRRRSHVGPDSAGHTTVEAAINTAYVRLIGQAGIPRPMNVRL